MESVTMQSRFDERIAGQECVITALASGGQQVRAGCLKLNRHAAVFEVYTPESVLQSSEVLTDFKIVINDRTAYAGRAVIANVISNGTSLVCEGILQDSWILTPDAQELTRERLEFDFKEFLGLTEKSFKILPEFKIVVADMQMFLFDIRQWLDQFEFGLHSQPSGNHREWEGEILRSLNTPFIPLMTDLFERFEQACRDIPPDSRASHSYYVKRQLHPIVLCAPFMYRSFHKPLGYAGDYEMVNMMMQDSYQGSSPFAKVLNSYFLSTPPVVAHKNRVTYLTRMLEEEACRQNFTGRPLRIFNLGCGPALEIQDFLANSELSDRAEFALLDFNDETIEHVTKILQELKRKYHRGTTIRCTKKSVIQLLKEAVKAAAGVSVGRYDVVYCAGLFDYLADPVCGKLMTIFYQMLAPGGLLVATNVYDVNPSRNWMEHSVDWHLIHRNRRAMLRICPEQASLDDCVVKADPIGLNLFLEVRKPLDD